MHTPGPLTIRPVTPGRRDYVIIDGTGDIIGEAYHDYPGTIDAEANARLWASAPALLADCKALLEAFEGYEMLAALPIDIQEKARQDIAKAEGTNG